MIAASHKENLLCNVVSSWKPSLSDLVNSSIPKKAGRKPGPQRYRPSHVAQERNVQDLEQTTPTEYQFPEEEKFNIRWLEGSKVTTCYGCKNKFRKTASDPVPTTLCYAESRSGRTHLKAQQASDSLLSPRTHIFILRSLGSRLTLLKGSGLRAFALQKTSRANSSQSI